MKIFESKDSAVALAKIKKHYGVFNKKYFKNNRLLFSILFSIALVYMLFAIFNTFFKIPVILFLGTVLGLYIYKTPIK